ncbi:MAG: toll/interleukin-1 receptor domain-containing protein, partial [Anaerolineales bacterium]
MTTTNRPLRVFLCHSSNDKPVVRELYQKLRAEAWLEPWLDEEELYPGQDWNLEIEKAVESADAIIVCLSNNSITKEGYVQRELRIVLDYADYKPEGTLYIIPVRLEECEPPRRLRAWQYADYFMGKRERSFGRLLVSLKRRAKSLGLTVEESATSAALSELKGSKNQVEISLA